MSSLVQYSSIIRTRGETVMSCGFQDIPQIRDGIHSLGRVTYPYHDYTSIKDMKAYKELMIIPFNGSIPDNIGLIVLGSVQEFVMKEFGVFFDKAKRFAFKKKFEKDLFHRVDKNFFTKTYDDDEYVIFSRLPDMKSLCIDK
ncbi:hypothetical protein PBCVCviKI_685R [Paramecium bursaria Chlorella virus CviKI]|nr:hypothetical protein PBCVCviKI_685R [Paramecium bursaria Chlorella virus CviKI]